MKPNLHLLPRLLRAYRPTNRRDDYSHCPNADQQIAVNQALSMGFIECCNSPAVPCITEAGQQFLDKVGEDNDAWDVTCSYLDSQGLGHSLPLIWELLLIFKHSPLAAQRMRLGLLQRQAADRAGLDIATICRCERQNRLPQSKIAVISYSAALELTPEALTRLVETRRQELLARCPQRVDTPEQAAAWAAAHAPTTAGQDGAADGVGGVHAGEHAQSVIA